MTQELINACASGNLEEVVRLLSISTTNINFIGNYSGKSATPLLAAIREHEKEIVTYLLQNGAHPALPTTEYDYRQADSYVYPFMLAIEPWHFEKSFFKQILPKVPVLNFWVHGKGMSYVPENLKKLADKAHPAASLLFHEGLFRDEQSFLKQLINWGYKPAVNNLTVDEYLGSRELSSREYQLALKNIQFLLTFSYITEKHSEDITKILSNKVAFSSATLNLFPLSLQEHLKAKPPQPFEELFRQLQNLIYDIPAISVNNPLFDADKKNYDTESLSEIEKLQNPVSFYSFLGSSTNEIFALLSRSYYQNEKESHAVILLAQLLYFHHSTSITVENQPQPWLTTDLQKKCLKLLEAWASFPEFNKLSFRENYHNQKEKDLLEEKNKKLEQEVFELKQKLEQTTQRVDQLFQLLDKKPIPLSNTNSKPTNSVLNYFKKVESQTTEEKKTSKRERQYESENQADPNGDNPSKKLKSTKL